MVEPITSKPNSKTLNNNVKIKWHETDTDYWKALVTEKVKKISSELGLDYNCDLETAIKGYMDILITSAQLTTKTSKRRGTK